MIKNQSRTQGFKPKRKERKRSRKSIAVKKKNPKDHQLMHLRARLPIRIKLLKNQEIRNQLLLLLFQLKKVMSNQSVEVMLKL